MEPETLASPIINYLQALHDEFLSLRDGQIADYIPELFRANPDWFGIAIVTVDGHVYQVGHSRQPFTIQSISKPIVYGLAMEDHGVEAVRARVGVEPSGEAFNSISLDPHSGCPLNPMINAGAVAVTGMISGANPADRMSRILKTFAHYVGHEVSVDGQVYASERDTGHRNRAISHMLRNFNVLENNPEEPLDLYFRQCSITVNCRDLAVMAASLANNGVNPITGMIAVKSRYVEKILSVMTTCGMYDYAGGWIYEVGMPAKSGVSGGIMAVLPGQLGIGIFSPPLDSKGNSVRAMAVCRKLSEDYNLHLFHTPRTSVSAIRARYDASRVHSKRVRPSRDYETLQAHGGRIRVYELHGDLVFGATEIVLGDILQDDQLIDYLILDFKRVLTADNAACRLHGELVQAFHQAGRQVLFTNARRLYAFTRGLKHFLGEEKLPTLLAFENIDTALEWCEERLLAQLFPDEIPISEAKTVQLELFEGLNEQEIQYLQEIMSIREFHPGELIIEHGSSAENIYFLLKGEASVMLPVEHGQHRLASVSAGMHVGEMAMLDSRPRSADVRAETRVVCQELPFSMLNSDEPFVIGVRAKLLHNLARGLALKLRYANEEIRALA